MKIMNANLVALALGLGAFGLPAFAQARETAASPYIQLYLKSWEMKKLEVDVARITQANEARVLERLRPLVGQGVISKQRFEEQLIKVEIAQLEVDNRGAEAAQAQSLYEVNKLRIENGLEVEICPEGE